MIATQPPADTTKTINAQMMKREQNVLRYLEK